MGLTLKEFTIYENSRIIDSLKKIDANKQGFVIVIDVNDHVLGVLTDGDVRRGLIKGFTVDEQVSAFFTRNATTVRISEGLNLVTELFKNEKIKFIPIVND